MATANLGDFLRRLTRGMAAETLADHSDQHLVETALAGCGEAAFQAIVHRHGPMVYRVCWRALQHPQDAEDAFQATFLILAQKLRTVRKHASLASWLHGVAHRVALKAKAQSAARRRHEHQASPSEALPSDDVTWGEFRSALDSELNQLPDKWRLPLILCYLEGRTQEESASQLGWSKSTLRRRLEEARTALGARLTGRGVAWSAAISAVLLSDCIASAAPAPGLVASTVEAAAGVAAGKTVAKAASATVATLTEGVMKAMFLNKVVKLTAMLLVLTLVTLTGGTLAKGYTDDTPQRGKIATPEAVGAKKAEVPQGKPADDFKEAKSLNEALKIVRKKLIADGKPEFAALVSEERIRKAVRLAVKNQERQLEIDEKNFRGSKEHFLKEVKPISMMVADKGSWPAGCSFTSFYEIHRSDDGNVPELTNVGFWLQLQIDTPMAKVKGYKIGVVNLSYGN
jgi:RNA polymerase sigma factor (sigma-70 family)